MNTAQIVEQVKEVIMKELLTDIDDKHCVLDLCIENGSCQPLSKVTVGKYYFSESIITRRY